MGTDARSEAVRRDFPWVRENRWLLGGVVALYLAYLLTRLALLWRMPLFWDEGFHAATAATGLDDPAQRFGAVADGKPPLFSWLAMMLMHEGLGAMTAVRLISFAGGLLALTALLWTGRVLGDWPVALVAGALYVLSPFAFVHDSLGLLDGLSAALLAATLATQWRLAARPTLLAAVGTGVVMALAILTRQVGYLGYVLLPLSLAVFDWGPDARWRRLLRWTALAALACVVAFAVTRVQALSPYATIPTPAQNRPVSDALRDPFGNVAAMWPGFRSTMTGYVGWGVLAFAVIGVAAGVVRRQARALAVACWACAPVALAFLLLSFGYPRYFYAAFPAVALIAAYGLVSLDLLLRRLRHRLLTGSRIALAAVAVAGTVVLDGQILVAPDTAPYPADDRWQLVSGWTAGTGLPQLADYLRNHAGPGTTVVGTTSYTPWNLATLLGDPLRVVTGGVPYQDGARVTLDDGRVVEFRIFDPTQPPQFVVNHSVFAPAESFTTMGYSEVYSFERPDSTYGGVPQPPTTVQLFELPAWSLGDSNP